MLRRARESLGLRQEDMAERMGVSTRAWQLYEADRSEPRAALLERLVDLGFAPDYVLRQNEPPASDLVHTDGRAVHLVDIKSRSADPFIGLPALGDRGHVAPDIHTAVLFRSSWLIAEMGEPIERLRVSTAPGDAMAPTIRSGDLLVLSLRDGFQEEGIYYLLSNGGPTLRRVARDHTGSLVLSADNPKYSHLTRSIPDPNANLSREQCAKVVWSGRKTE